MVSFSFLFLLFPVTTAYVFSCNEIKYKLMNTARTEPSAYACVILQEGFTASFVDNIFLKTQGDKASYSLTTVAGSNSSCEKAPSGSPWIVTSTLSTDQIDCTYEITLIFSNDLPNFIIPTKAAQSAAVSSLSTIVSPWGGLRIDGLSCAQGANTGSVRFYTGVGEGSGEQQFEMALWKCTDVPKTYVAFENVIGIEAVNGCTLSFTVTTAYTSGSMYLEPGDNAAVASSGRADNVQDLHPDFNYAKFQLNAFATVTVTGELQMDPAYNGAIQLVITGPYINETRNFTDATLNWTFYGSYFEVHYLTSVQSQDIWLNSDNFVIEIALSELPTDLTTPPYGPAGPTTALTVGSATPPAETSDDACGTCNYEHLWLDVIVLLDESKAMGDDGLSAVLEFLNDPLNSMHLPDQVTPNDLYYTRSGLIYFANTIDIKYDLNMTSGQTYDVPPAYVDADVLDFEGAVQAAMDMFSRHSISTRNHTRQVIVFGVSTYSDFNHKGLDSFKTGNGTVIVYQFVQEGQEVDPELKDLASKDEYFFTSLTVPLPSLLNLYCEINCFCTADYTEYFNRDGTFTPQGGCYRVVHGAPVSYKGADHTCTNEGGYVATVHDADKHSFLSSLMASVGTRLSYWIGLTYNGANWVWSDNLTDPYQFWSPGQPMDPSVNSCAFQQQGPGYTIWGNSSSCTVSNNYICEFLPCSSNKYCY